MRTVLFDLTILSTETRVRGIGRYAADLAVQLAAASSDALRVLFLDHIGWDGRVSITDDAAAAVARLQEPALAEAGRWSWAYRLRLGATRAVRAADAQVLHLPHSGATPLFDTGAARVVTCHDLIPLLYPEHYAAWQDGFGRGRRWLDSRRFTTADHVIAISHATAGDLTRLLGVRPDHISVVHHGIDRAQWPAAEAGDDAQRVRALGLPDHFALYVGDADWRKNHRVMLKALAKARSRGVHLPLAWAGRLSDERMSLLERDARDAGADVRWLGFVCDADLKALYRRALMNLFVSRAEGFGLPVLEAMTIGCPVITSNRSSMVEIAGDGAWLVDPDRPQDVADAIVVLASDADERARLRARGMAHAKKFTPERQTQQTLQVYRSLDA